MARAPAAAESGPSGTEVGFAKGTSIEAFDPSELAGLTGMGYSDKPEDTLVPIISILQENSAEAKANHPKAAGYADQKEKRIPGNLIIRSLKMLLDVNQEPLPVIPCGFVHTWQEWDGEPGEGKPAGRYPFEDRPEDAEEIPDPNDKEKKRTFWRRRGSGNRLVDTREWYCLAKIGGAWMPVMIPMGGTNHTVARQWTAIQKNKLNPTTGEKVPSWFVGYMLKTEYHTAGSQSWFTYNITEGGWVMNKALRDQGRALFESLEDGIISPDVDGEVDEGGKRAPQGNDEHI